ncbi:MAG TPA: peptide MFS transporter [Rhizomicrobium sp.]
MKADAALAEDREVLPRDLHFLGHPLGLAYLAFTEAFERFSFYGMQVLLVLYMVDQLLRPGHIEHILGFSGVRAALETVYGPLSTQALSSQIFGWYTALVYVTPLLGGYLGDRWLGRRSAVSLGALIMALGNFLMMFETSFVAALGCLVLGCGLLKGNIASQVGLLYSDTDPRRADAFQVYVLAINAGVIAAPLICGSLGEEFGWRYGFAAAGAGMLLALCIYLSGYRHLPADNKRERTDAAVPRTALTSREWRAITALLLLLPILAVAFVGNNQIYNVYMIWARDNANLTLFGFRMPVTWLQSWDAGVGTAGLALGVWFWRRMAKRGIAPHELTKLLLGCATSVAGFVILALAAYLSAHTAAKIALPWLLAFHIVNTLGYINILPVALALFSRASPPSVNATMIGIFYLLFFGANVLVGWIGSFYQLMDHTSFWMLHAGLCAASTLAILVLYRPLRAAL